MSDETSISYLGLITIVLTVLGIGIILLNKQQIGLTVLFSGILFFAGTVVYNRLQRLGAEAFALGSIMTWIGFLLIALPVLGFAWQLFSFSIQLILFFSGILLVLLGLTTEHYDLNKKFLEFLNKTMKNLRVAIITIRKRLLRSIWTVLIILSLIYLGLSYLIPVILLPLSNIPIVMEYPRIAILIFIIILSFIEFREVLKIFFKSILEGSYIFLQGIYQRLRHFPTFIRQVFHLFRRILSIIWSITVQVLQSFGDYIYGVALISGIIFGVFSILRSDPILQSISIFLIIAGLSTVITSSPRIESGIARVQQETYKRSLILKNLISRSHKNICRHCGQQSENDKICSNCNEFIPSCMICRQPISQNEEVLQCTSCEYEGHSDHIKNWISINPQCPNCKTGWS